MIEEGVRGKMIKNLHNALAISGKKIGRFTLVLIGFVLHLCPLSALCGSFYLAAIVLDSIGIGFLWGLPFFVLWFLFVCFYVADHVQPIVAEAATKLGNHGLYGP